MEIGLDSYIYYMYVVVVFIYSLWWVVFHRRRNFPIWAMSYLVSFRRKLCITGHRGQFYTYFIILDEQWLLHIIAIANEVLHLPYSRRFFLGASVEFTPVHLVGPSFIFQRFPLSQKVL